MGLTVFVVIFEGQLLNLKFCMICVPKVQKNYKFPIYLFCLNQTKGPINLSFVI